MEFRTFTTRFARHALAHELWSHPWFERLRTQPTLGALRLWAVQAGMIDEIFASILAALRANPLVPAAAHAAIERNIADEEGRSAVAPAHFCLFQNVLAAMDVTLPHYRQARILPGTGVILTGLRNAVGGDAVRALAVMASEEFICPREFPRLMDALRRIKGEDRAQWEPYFAVHCTADKGHAADLLEQLYLACAGNPELLERVFACQQEDLLWNTAFYDSLLLAALERR